MDLFELGRMLHSTAGTVALVCFWIAAVAVKGSDVHRRAGKVYLQALVAVMTLSSLMVAGRAVEGDRGVAIFLGFLISIVGTATWLMWFSVRYKHQEERLHGVVYRALASWLILAGAGLFSLGVMRRAPMMMLLSMLGLGFGANMWRLALARVRDRRWWLGQHMNGAMLNFIATHDSFIALGIGTVVPELRQPIPRMLIAAGIIAAGVTLRVALSTRFLRAASPRRVRALESWGAGERGS